MQREILRENVGFQFLPLRQTTLKSEVFCPISRLTPAGPLTCRTMLAFRATAGLSKRLRTALDARTAAESAAALQRVAGGCASAGGTEQQPTAAAVGTGGLLRYVKGC